MKTFLRVLDRTMLHLYCVAGLLLALLILGEEVHHHRAVFAEMDDQSEALNLIAVELRGKSM